MTSTASIIPRIEAVCEGSPFDMGLAQGAALRDKVHGARRMLRDLEVFRMRQPFGIPYFVYRWLAERKARALLGPALSQHHPSMATRLAALADGAGISLASVQLINLFEPMLSSATEITAPPGACSAVAVRGRRSATGEPIIARNFDYLPITQPFFILRQCRPHHGFGSIDFTTAPLGGALDGVNERGLCVTYDYAFPADRPPSPAPSISMIISETLERCSTVAEAIQWISSRPRWGGALLMLADADGDIASLELSNTRVQARRPEPGQDLLFHSNAFGLPEMKEVEIPRDAVFSNRAPVSMRGRRLHESAETRDARLAALVKERETFTAEELARLMSDHGPTGAPDSQTVCVHGSYWFTTASMQYFPKSRRMNVAYSTACQARYETFEL